MITAFILGIIVGILMCIPIGPLNLWVISTYLKKGTTRALAIAGGGSVMDFCYFFLILSGLSFFHFSERWSQGFQTTGLILIFLLGIKELFIREEIPSTRPMTPTSNKRPLIDAPIGYFVLGLILYTSNPTLVLTMSGLATFIKGMSLFANNLPNNFFLSLGLSLGSFLWFLFLVGLIKKYREQIVQKYLVRFSQISGVLMIGCAVLMTIKLFY